MMSNKLPIVVGVEIPLDEHGRYNLNTLHKASGEGKSKTPNKWLETKQAQELIKQLQAKLLKTFQTPNSGLAQNVINVVKGGSSPGTFAHELIAVSYAGWIRPDFQLDVNQAFIDYKSGSPELKLPTLSHMSGEFETLRNRLVLDEKEESALLTQCARIMNARKKTKSKRQRLMDALKDAGQDAFDFGGGVMMGKFGLFLIYLIAFVCTVVIGIATGMPKQAVYALGLWSGFIASLIIEEI